MEDDSENDADAPRLFDMARVSAERAEEHTKSDDEKTVLEEDAARYSGAYFRSQNQRVEDMEGRVNKALEDRTVSVQPRDRVEMNQRERDRLKVLHGIEQGLYSQAKAAELLHLTVRQVRRLQRRLEVDGDAGLVHGLRGKASNRREDLKVRKQIVQAYRKQFVGFGPTGESVVKKTTGKEYVYYRCSQYNAPGHPRVRLNEEKLDRQILAVFDRMRIEDEVQRDWVASQIRRNTVLDQATSKVRRAELNRQITLVLQQKDQLVNMRLNGEIEADTYAAKATELRDRVAMLKFKLDACDLGRDENTKLRSRLLNFRKACVQNGLRLTTPNSVGFWRLPF